MFGLKLFELFTAMLTTPDDELSEDCRLPEDPPHEDIAVNKSKKNSILKILLCFI